MVPVLLIFTVWGFHSCPVLTVTWTMSDTSFNFPLYTDFRACISSCILCLCFLFPPPFLFLSSLLSAPVCTNWESRMRNTCLLRHLLNNSVWRRKEILVKEDIWRNTSRRKRFLRWSFKEKQGSHRQTNIKSYWTDGSNWAKVSEYLINVVKVKFYGLIWLS